jgi:hypothetical protein
MLPPAVKLLSDALHIAQGLHRAANISKSVDLAAQTRSHDTTQKVRNRIINASWLPTYSTVRSLSQDLDGTFFFIRSYLRARHNKNSQPDGEDREAYDPLVTEVIDPRELRDLDILHLAFIAGSMRLDEFSDLPSYLRLDSDGKVSFNKALLAVEPEPSTLGSKGTHTKRLRCPALYVSGLFRSTLGIVSDIVIRANELTTRAAQL